MRSSLVLALLVACSQRDPAPERRTPESSPPAPSPVMPLPARTASPTETITAFVEAARKHEYLMEWLAPEITMTAQCETKQMTPTYAWLWLENVQVTWPAARTCKDDCCIYTWAQTDGDPRIDGTARRICASAGRITEIRMWCADVDPKTSDAALAP